MRPREDYTLFILIALGLTLAILIVFQLYLAGEDQRIEDQKQADLTAAIDEGEHLFEINCTSCHGQEGEGGVAPALNSHELLTSTSNETLFNLTVSGVPGSIMPAWGQAFGGPFTDEQIGQLVVFVRSWEPTAPELVTEVEMPDSVRGAAIYARTCFVCHGENGIGTDVAPALNDERRLSRLDNAWYRSTIATGRPARGMPTWGTVLSPSQIDDVVALIAAWREGETVEEQTPLATYISYALFAIQDFDPEDAEYFLNAALPLADAQQVAEINSILELVRDNQLFLAEGRVSTLLPLAEMGQAVFATNCASCHGTDGRGAMGPNLRSSSFVAAQNDENLIAFLQTGRPGTPMVSFNGILSEIQLRALVALMRSWHDE